MRKLLGKNDLVLAAVLINIALIFWLFLFFINSEKEVVAIIEHNGVCIEKIELLKINDEITFEIEGSGLINVKIKAQQGKIRFESSDCADLVCVRTGWLSKKGQMAVCLPAKICIYIKGTGKIADAITG